MDNHHLFMDKSTINGLFSIAMLNYQGVYGLRTYFLLIQHVSWFMVKWCKMDAIRHSKLKSWKLYKAFIFGGFGQSRQVCPKRVWKINQWENFYRIDNQKGLSQHRYTVCLKPKILKLKYSTSLIWVCPNYHSDTLDAGWHKTTRMNH